MNSCFLAWELDIEPPMESIMFVELDTREADGLTISLEWDRDTGTTQVVVQDVRGASQMAFPVPRQAPATPSGIHSATRREHRTRSDRQ